MSFPTFSVGFLLSCRRSPLTSPDLPHREPQNPMRYLRTLSVVLLLAGCASGSGQAENEQSSNTPITQPTDREWPVSAHYDGKRFYNTSGADKGAGDACDGEEWIELHNNGDKGLFQYDSDEEDDLMGGGKRGKKGRKARKYDDDDDEQELSASPPKKVLELQADVLEG